MNYNKGFNNTNRYNVGAFYFDTSVIVEAPLNNIFITPQKADVYSYKDVELDFIATPLKSASPFEVTFTPSLRILSTCDLVFDYYEWYFDYDRDQDNFVIGDRGSITHTYNGVYGTKYSVKLVVKFVDSAFSDYELKSEYITSLGQDIPIRFGKDTKVDLMGYLPETLRI